MKRERDSKRKRPESTRGIRFDPDVLDLAMARAKQEDRSMNSVVNRALRDALSEPTDIRSKAVFFLRGEGDPDRDTLLASMNEAFRVLSAPFASSPKARDPITEWEPIRKLRPSTVARGDLSNVDRLAPLYATELPVVAYVAAGEGREPTAEPTGETVWVPNPQARRAIKDGWEVVKVVGDSMEPEWEEGDFVLIKRRPDQQLQDGDVAAVWYQGQPMLKILRFERGKDRRLMNVRLLSLNPAHRPITVSPEDEFRILGTQESSFKGKKRFNHD